MTHIENIACKVRRALRNETGVRLTFEELKALVERGVWNHITDAETDEIKQAWKRV